MANKNKNKQPINKTKKQASKKQTTKDPREPSPKEILFFKIGMSIIGLAVIVIAIIFIVQFYMDKADENPFEDYVVVTVDELLLLTQYDEDLGTYGDPDTLKQDAYEEINGLFQDSDYFYVYFYHSTSIDDEIAAAIEDYTGSDQIPTMTLLDEEADESYKAFYFFDLDSTVNASISENTAFDHLNLDLEAENILLTFSHNDNEFSSTIDINEILSTITDLQS